MKMQIPEEVTEAVRSEAGQPQSVAVPKGDKTGNYLLRVETELEAASRALFVVMGEAKERLDFELVLRCVDRLHKGVDLKLRLTREREDIAS